MNTFLGLALIAVFWTGVYYGWTGVSYLWKQLKRRYQYNPNEKEPARGGSIDLGDVVSGLPADGDKPHYVGSAWPDLGRPKEQYSLKRLLAGDLPMVVLVGGALLMSFIFGCRFSKMKCVHRDGIWSTMSVSNGVATVVGYYQHDSLAPQVTSFNFRWQEMPEPDGLFIGKDHVGQ